MSCDLQLRHISVLDDDIDKENYFVYWGEDRPTLYRMSPVDFTIEKYNSDNSIFYPFNEDDIARARRLKVIGYCYYKDCENLSLRPRKEYALMVEAPNGYQSWCHCSYTIVEAFNLSTKYIDEVENYEPVSLMFEKKGI